MSKIDWKFVLAWIGCSLLSFCFWAFCFWLAM
jgi:hypothetical protein